MRRVLFALEVPDSAVWVIFPEMTMTKSAGVERVRHTLAGPLDGLRSGTQRSGLVLGLALLMGCALPPQEAAQREGDEMDIAPSAQPSPRVWARLHRAAGQLMQTPDGGSDWRPWLLPGKSFAAFDVERHQGIPSITVKANRSVSILRQRFVGGVQDAKTLSFTWQVDALALGADLSTSEGDDSPVRIVLAFEGDRSMLSPRAHRLSEMSRLLTGEDLPYATLAYVWSNTDAPGTVVVNRRSDRIRKIVVESGAGRVGRWLTYERDVQADFLAAFGEAPGRLVAIALMTDTDNTQSALQAWYGPLNLKAGPQP